MEPKMKSKNSLNYKIAMTALFSALSIVLAFTPLGYIQLGGAIVITLMHIPAILAALLGGVVPGVCVGLVFGLSSLIRTVMTGAAAGPFFLNPCVSVFPRMIFPLVASGVFFPLSKIRFLPKAVSAGIASAAATLFHTMIVMAAICFFYGDIFFPLVKNSIEKLGFSADGISPFKNYLLVLFSTLITNGFFEIVAAVILVSSVFASLYLVESKKSKISKIDDE
jgi:uncharacterized membrane protein